MSVGNFNIFNVKDKKIITLHLSWLAFFITFFMWFSHTSLMPLIVKAFDLSSAEAKALLFLNVALTIPSRTLIGMLVDKFGPRLMFSILLAISGVLCIGFALAQTYEQLAAFRFLLGFAGAGFVIGIRLITEWFPAQQAGTAQGVYGGWGNFGAAAAGFILPAIAALYGGVEGWRVAAGSAGIVAIFYSLIFYLFIKNTPKGSRYFSPKKLGPMEVTSRGDMFLYSLMCAPMSLAMGVIAWRLSPAGVGLISADITHIIWGALFVWFAYQLSQIYKINNASLKEGISEIHCYKFKQVALLNLAYMVTFGSEVAVVSMLPLYFIDTFNVSIGIAAAMASSFMAMNLIARPGGGYISDKIGRKRSLLITLLGSGMGYFGLSLVDGSWSITATMIVVIFCSFFVQAGAGATFGVVPTIKRRLTGQIAGLTGAYGNVGAASFLLIYSLTDAMTFFSVICISCLVVFILMKLFLDEPKGQIAEILPDGTVELISID